VRHRRRVARPTREALTASSCHGVAPERRHAGGVLLGSLASFIVSAVATMTVEVVVISAVRTGLLNRANRRGCSPDRCDLPGERMSATTNSRRCDREMELRVTTRPTCSRP